MELPRRGLITYTWAMSAGLTVRAATLSSSQAEWITIIDTGRYGGYGLGGK